MPVPAPAGSIVVFSSLTPHSTGPNRTGAVRKAYIVQFAPSGAEVIRTGPGEPPTRIRADDAARQYEILRDGESRHALGASARRTPSRHCGAQPCRTARHRRRADPCRP